MRIDVDKWIENESPPFKGHFSHFINDKEKPKQKRKEYYLELNNFLFLILFHSGGYHFSCLPSNDYYYF